MTTKGLICFSSDLCLITEPMWEMFLKWCMCLSNLIICIPFREGVCGESYMYDLAYVLIGLSIFLILLSIIMLCELITTNIVLYLYNHGWDHFVRTAQCFKKAIRVAAAFGGGDSKKKMSKEEVFYKKLYYYLKHPVLNSWVWPPDVEPCLKKVINWKLFQDARQLTQRDIAKRWAEVEQNEFAYALFQILFDDQAIGFASLLSIAMDNPGTVLEGFCWLYSYEEPPRSLGRLQRAATQTCFAYAKVVYGKYLLEDNQLKESLEIFRHAAQDLNEPSAWYELGLFYEKGLVEDVKDDTYALQCYKKSAKLDSTIGMEQVGRCYKEGIGTFISLTKAIKWLSKVPEHQQRHYDVISLLHTRQKVINYVSKKSWVEYKICDCFKCRTLLYFGWRINCSPGWLSRWDKCMERCVLVIACFRHHFRASGVGKMVARHLWSTRAEDCWKHRIKN